MRAADQAGMVHSLAWVVMPDHLHWLVELKQGSLAQLMCRVKSRSSRSVNLLRGNSSRCGNAAITTELCVAMKILKPLPLHCHESIAGRSGKAFG
jgi:REP element-mobilizing transposase RayT